ncbi:MAG: GcvT family protein [bacterium]
MAESKNIIIIGGGVIGLSVACHLGKLGAKNVLLLERNELTSGTSWHAAGIVGPLRASRNLTVLSQYAVELFQQLESETGQATGYKITGGLYLARHRARMFELKRVAAIGEMNGLRNELLTPAQIKARIECVHTEDLAGALWVEKDGQINPVDLCMAYAKSAKAAGVEIREHAGVGGFVLDDTFRGKHISAVILEDGQRIECESVVNCAGLWARQVGDLAGVPVPLQAVEHMYAVSAPLPSLPRPFPVLRDLDAGIYIKEDAGRLVFGAFEANAKLWHPERATAKQSFLMFGDDPEHAEPMLEAALHRIPALCAAGLQRFITGPESFTPDTRQIMGRSPQVENFFVAAGFNSIGIMSSAGVGKAMADWVVHGEPGLDMWEVDIARFEARDNDAAFLHARAPEAVHNQFAMHWPFKQFKTGRDRQRSAWHGRLAEAGAVFGAPSGWERPLWFARPGEAREIRYSHEQQHWWPYAAREAEMLAQSGALFDLSPFTKLLVSGDNAGAFLQHLCSSDIPETPGRVIYTLMLNPVGGIEVELTVTVLSEQRYLLVSAAAVRARHWQWMRRHLPASGGVAVNDVTERFAVAGLMGPNASACMQRLLASDFSHRAFPFAHSRPFDFNGSEIIASRVSFVGESGWEIYVPLAAAGDFYAALRSAMAGFEIGHAGLFCLEGCRLEKGYPHWGHDIGREDSPRQAGLMFAVHLDKPAEFVGRDALRTGLSSRQRLVLFEVGAAQPLLLHDEPVYRDGHLVGRTTSGGLGFRTGKALCFAHIDTGELNRETLFGASYEIAIAGEGAPLRPLRTPPYDPHGKKMRGDES